MRWVSARAKRLSATAVCLFLLAGLIRVASYRVSGDRLGALFSAAPPMIYVGLLIAWIISLNWRILARGIRRLLIASSALMIFYMLIRTAKYQFFPAQDVLLRHLWYAYYIPMIAIPLLQFLAALRVGRREEERIDARWRLLVIPAALLIAGVLTNDLHQFAFRFHPGFLDWERAYARGWLYTAAFLWIAILLASALATIARKRRAAKVERGVWLPFAPLLIGMVYMVWGLTDHFIAARKIFQMPEMYCFMIVAFWELSIQIGLIPSNIGHSDFFAVSTVRAQIADAHGDVRHRSRNAPPLSHAQMVAAAPVMIAPNTRLHSHPIRAGRIYWTDDLTDVNALNAQLQEIGETLSQENELIQGENRMKRRQARIAEQNRLYDNIARVAATQLKRMDQILKGLSPDAPDFARSVGHARVLNAYVKRRSNLMLIAETKRAVPAEELSHCIRESADCLRAYGALCSFHGDAQGDLRVERVMLAYDLFEAAAEAALPGVTSIMINLTARAGGLTLRLSMEDATARVAHDWRRDALAAQSGAFSQEMIDGTSFVTLRFEKAGEDV
ncbi:MAG: hypothetical protein ACOYI5_03420 [Christensenellales bacterium]|jgi:hypothetical protein